MTPLEINTRNVTGPDQPFTIPGLLQRSSELWPDRPYLVTRGGSVISRLTFSDVALQVDLFSVALQRQGIVHGDHVALLSDNRARWVIAYFAILRLGAVVIPLDPLLPPEDLLRIVTLSKTKLLIASARLADLMKSQSSGPLSIPILDLEEIPSLESGQTHELDVDSSSIRPQDTAVIIFTSGTTGTSKGVVITHGNICADVHGVLDSIDIHPGDNFLLLLPLHHTYSATVNMLCPLASGTCTTLATSYKSRDILEDIRLAGVTLLVGVPQVFENIRAGILRAVAEASLMRRLLFDVLRRASDRLARIGIPCGRMVFRRLRAKAGLSSVRVLISGGAALHSEDNWFFHSLGFVMIQGYGLTEASPILTVNSPLRNRVGSVGLAIRGVELKILAPDSAKVGEICARGPNIMQGYFENPEASAGVLKEGWLHTGDAGYIDREGFLHITGRLKNVIVSAAGKNVYPEEIEARLDAEPSVRESLVVGIKRRKGGGEELAAILVPQTEWFDEERSGGRESDVDGEMRRVIEAHNRAAPAYWRLKRWQVRSQEFEKTSTRKIKRLLYTDLFRDTET